MRTMDEIVSDRQQSKKVNVTNDFLARNIGRKVGENIPHQEAPKLEMNFDVGANLKAETIEIAGLESALKSFVDQTEVSKQNMLKLIKVVENIVIKVPKMPEIKIPDWKIPKIEVPKANITVNVPPIKVPTAQITVKVPKGKEEIKKRIVEEKYIYNERGTLESVIETYDDGSIIRADGFSKNKVTYEYK